jgi:hypothetical protein
LEVVMVRRFVSSWRLMRTLGLAGAAVAVPAVGVVGALTNMAPPAALAPTGEPVVVVTQARPTEKTTSPQTAAVVPVAIPSQPVKAAAPAAPAELPKKPAPAAVVEPVKPAPPKVETTASVPAKIEQKIEPRIDPAKTEPARTEPPKLETAAAEPIAAEPAETEAAPAPPARPKHRTTRASNPRVAVAEHGIEGPAVVARTRRPAPFSIRDLPRR